MILATLRRLFYRPDLGNDLADFHKVFRERSYKLAILVSILGAVDGTILSILSLNGLSPLYATRNVAFNIALVWFAPAMLLALRKRSLRLYPWIISISVLISNGQYLFHVLHDVINSTDLFSKSELTLALTRNSTLHANDSHALQLRDAFWGLQLRTIIVAFWLTAIVPLPFAFSAPLTSSLFIVYGSMICLTAEHPHDAVYALVRVGFVVFLGIMVASILESRERRLFIERKRVRITVDQYEDAQAAAVQQIKTLEDSNRREFVERAEFMSQAFHDIKSASAAFAWALGNYQTALSLNRQKLAEEALHTMEKAANSAAKLVMDLLDLTNYEKRKQPISCEPVDVLKLLEDAIAAASPSALAKHLKMRLLNKGEAETFGLSNDISLTRVVTLLLDNAIKFTHPHHSEEYDITVELAADEDTVRIAVRDRGVGIPESSKEKIWEYSMTTTGTNKESGFGMGLPMVRAICGALPMHDIDVSSATGQGSTFIISVPRCQAPTKSLVTSPRAFGGSQASVKRRLLLENIRVLLTENHEVTREAEASMLQLLGAEVVATAAISEAIDACDREGRKPDLLITDFHLNNGETGAELITAVRSRLKKSIPAVIVTADNSTEPVEAVSALECVMILTKPVKRHTLLTAVNHLLQSDALKQSESVVLQASIPSA